jgi:hypothetical protein
MKSEEDQPAASLHLPCFCLTDLFVDCLSSGMVTGRLQTGTAALTPVLIAQFFHPVPVS